MTQLYTKWSVKHPDMQGDSPKPRHSHHDMLPIQLQAPSPPILTLIVPHLCAHTHMHTHMHAHTCTYTHVHTYRQANVSVLSHKHIGIQIDTHSGMSEYLYI